MRLPVILILSCFLSYAGNSNVTPMTDAKKINHCVDACDKGDVSALKERRGQSFLYHINLANITQDMITKMPYLCLLFEVSKDESTDILPKLFVYSDNHFACRRFSKKNYLGVKIMKTSADANFESMD